MWDLANKKCITSIQAHEGFVRGLCVEPMEGEGFITVGDDKCIKHWAFTSSSAVDEPTQTIPTKVIFQLISPIKQIFIPDFFSIHCMTYHTVGENLFTLLVVKVFVSGITTEQHPFEFSIGVLTQYQS